MSNNEHREVLRYCTKAIRFFKNKPYEARESLQVFYYMQLISNIQLRQLKPGLAAAALCLEQVEEGSFNWFKFKELVLRLMLHTRQYAEALEAYQPIRKHAQMAGLPEASKASWLLFQNYFDFLHQHGGLAQAPTELPGNVAFSVEMNQGEKQETGMYTAWNVLDWFHLLEQQNFDLLRKRSVELKAYSEQYLKQAITRRSYHFLQLLAAASGANFEPSAMDALAGVYLTKIKKLPAQIGLQTAEIELVPYEELWPIARKLVQNALVWSAQKQMTG